MWEPFRSVLRSGLRSAALYTNSTSSSTPSAVDEVRRRVLRRAKDRDVIKEEVAAAERWKTGKDQRGVLNRFIHLNRRVFKAYLLKESLEKLWD